MRIWFLSLSCLLCHSSLLGCEGGRRATADAPVSAIAERARTRGPSAVSIEVPSGTVGPFMSPAGTGWLAAWAAPEAERSFAWFASRFAPDGRPVGAPQRLMAASSQPDLVRFRTTPRQAMSMLVASHATEAGYLLSALAIGHELTAVAPSEALHRTANRVVWIDLVPSRAGTLVVWAEAQEQRAALFALRLDERGHPRTPPSLLHDNARAWQVLSTPPSAMLGVVTADGNVEAVPIDGDGVAAAPLVITDQHSAEPDLDLARSGDNVLVAFTDRRVLEPQLFSALLSADGRLRSTPALMRPPRGAQSLVALESDGKSSYVLWQNVAQEPGQYRIARVDARGRAYGPSLRLPRAPQEANTRTEATDWAVSRGAVPELVAFDSGLAALAPACVGAGPCVTPSSPVLVDLTKELSPRSASFWFPMDQTPDLVWDFQCNGERCASLFAYYGEAARVLVRTSDSRGIPAVEPELLQVTADDAAAFQAVLVTPELAAISSNEFEDGALVAWLTAFDPNIPYEIPKLPAPDGRLAPVRARLKTQWLSATPEPHSSRADSSEERTVSIRARSVAGIELTASRTRALLTWTAIDGSSPQVFNTLLDPRGNKLGQEMLTRQSGEVLDVAATIWRAGWLVGWVREHAGVTGAHVAHLGETLGRRSPNIELLTGTGVLAGIELGTTAKGVWAVISEVTASGEGLRWMALDANSLRPSPVATTPPFDVDAAWRRSQPRLRTWNDGLALAWLEQKGAEHRVVVVELDAQGQLLDTHDAPLPARGVSLALQCSERCHVIVTTESESGAPGAHPGVIWSAHVARGGRTREGVQRLKLARVAAVASPAAIQVAPSPTPAGLFYYDRATLYSDHVPLASSADSASAASAIYQAWVQEGGWPSGERATSR